MVLTPVSPEMQLLFITLNGLLYTVCAKEKSISIRGKSVITSHSCLYEKTKQVCISLPIDVE